MSDLIKSEQSSKVTPSGRGTRGRGKADRAKVDLKATEQQVDIVASSTLVDAAIDLADAETAAAGRAYGDRLSENLPQLGSYFQQVQARNAEAIRKQAFAAFDVTEEEIYGASDS